MMEIISKYNKYTNYGNSNKHSLTKGKSYKIISYTTFDDLSTQIFTKLDFNPSKKELIFKIVDDTNNIRYCPNHYFLSTREINIKKILNI